jgi:hypothetical protein
MQLYFTALKTENNLKLSRTYNAYPVATLSFVGTLPSRITSLETQQSLKSIPWAGYLALNFTLEAMFRRGFYLEIPL